MPTFTWSYLDPSPSGLLTTTLVFDPAQSLRLIEPRYSPIQRVSIAESGQVWVFQLSSNIELELILDVLDMPTSRTKPIVQSTDGYLEMYEFLSRVVNWSQRNWTLTDPDGDSFLVKNIRGCETLKEASGRGQRADFWTGSLTLRRVI